MPVQRDRKSDHPQAPITPGPGQASGRGPHARHDPSPGHGRGTTSSTRRRERVLTALSNAIRDGDQVSVSGIARAARVDRTFLYRHRQLLDQVHAAAAQPPGAPGAVTRASLQADLLAAQQRCVRMAARAQQLETRLSALLGEQAWRESGLGAPDDMDQFKQQIVKLEQHVIDLRLQLKERDQGGCQVNGGTGCC